MKIREHIKQFDVLAQESPLFEIPMRKEYLLREIGRGKKVLDLGCSGGQISKLIKEQNNDVYGVELNPRAAQVAEEKGIRVKIFDLNDGIPFEDGAFDVVNAGRVLEHIYDSKFLFEEVNRVLSRHGVFLFTIVNLNSIGNRWRILTGSYPSSLGAYPEDAHGENIRIFNAEKIKELCIHTGFKIVNITGIPALTKQSLQYRMLSPVVRLMPQLGELLLVKAQRVDQ